MKWIDFSNNCDRELLEDCTEYLIIGDGRITHVTWDAVNDWFYYVQGDTETIIRPWHVNYFGEIDWPEGMVPTESVQ